MCRMACLYDGEMCANLTYIQTEIYRWTIALPGSFVSDMKGCNMGGLSVPKKQGTAVDQFATVP